MKRALITPTIAALATVGLAFTAAADTPVPPPTERVSVEQINTCDDLEVTVYFAAHDAMMSSYSYRTIEAASDQLSECAVTSIEARVISEEAHTDESLAKLSEARANAVLQP
jgi:outer membrane protein OmpA-like peptidoglycan-associated protein